MKTDPKVHDRLDGGDLHFFCFVPQELTMATVEEDGGGEHPLGGILVRTPIPSINEMQRQELTSEPSHRVKIASFFEAR